MTTGNEIILSVRSLPTIPAAVAQLSRLITDDDADSGDFEEIISRDPALTTNLLKLANSPYFGMRRQVTSVRSAVTLMGAQRVFEVAASAGFSRVLPVHLAGYDLEASEFWRHCVAVAVLSEKIRVAAGSASPELIFTAGLLHDLGKLVIGDYLRRNRDTFAEKIDRFGVCRLKAERDVLGTDHLDIGKFVADRWNLPESVAVAARWHHRPSDAPSPEHREIADPVHLADLAAHSMGFGGGCKESDLPRDEGALERTGLTPARIEEIGETVRDGILHLATLF